ncbi:MAG TPA: hypothetical protein VF310_15835, partial [Vicinamibacteria bacterium]
MMRIPLSLLLAAAVASSPPPSGAPTDVEKLAALARLYGAVRWFHPTDAAQEIDWNRMALRGVKAVRAARTTPELERALQELFAPVSAGLVVGASLPAPAAAAPPSAERLVAWRHLGLGFGGEGGGVYSSARTGRRSPSEIDGFASLMQSIPAGSLRGKKVRLTGQVKADVTGESGAAALWLRVDRGGEQMGLFDNMNDRPIRTPEWREYAIEGTVDADAVELAFGVIARGHVRAGFDDVKLAVRGTDGGWEPVPTANPGFEQDVGWSRVGTSRRAVITYPQQGAPQGARWASVAPPAGDDQPLFEAPLRAGAFSEVDLGLGLRARVPLVLTAAEADVDPDRRAVLETLKAELARLPEAGDPSDGDVRAADVVVAWSVFRHFYPYWEETGVDWDAHLRPLLEDSAAPSTRAAHLDALRRLVAEVHDGHGGVMEMTGPRVAALPIALRLVEGRLVVSGSAVPEQVKAGDVVTAVEGRPAAEWLAQQMALYSGSPQWRRSQAAAAPARGPEGSRVSLQLEREGQPLKIDLV